MPRLDSLRAIAVAAVTWHHWMPHHQYGVPFASGVQLFFVLSGFLITTILLEARQKKDLLTVPQSSHVLFNFYARRFIRIFPLYYAVLIAATCINVSNLRATYLWHALYLSNYYFISIQALVGPIAHFWTLAVEEQFYLLWPFVVLFAPRRLLPTIFAVFAAVGPIYRQACDWFFPNINLLYIATPGSFDSLAIGALLAYFERFPNEVYMALISRRSWLYLLVTGVYLFLTYSIDVPGKPGALSGSFLSILFALIIFDTAHENFRGPLGQLLDLWPLRYLGKISYGLYILHPFASIPTGLTLHYIAEPIGQLFDLWPFRQAKIRTVTRLMLMTFWTIAGAAISWHFFEAPINRLKRHFPYLKADPTKIAHYALENTGIRPDALPATPEPVSAEEGRGSG
jgi:peptidoglycan/LPS O-acetylase OafA/YrhL